MLGLFVFVQGSVEQLTIVHEVRIAANHIIMTASVPPRVAPAPSGAAMPAAAATPEAAASVATAAAAPSP